MNRTPAASKQATLALNLVSSLQQRFVKKLEGISQVLQQRQTFSPVEWGRDEGKHGGGIRFETGDGEMIGRGSVNVSQVHYDDNPNKKLGSASAISTIIHPVNPLSPSVHIHISWTEMKDGQGYWRMMADLNPAVENKQATQQFLATLEASAPQQHAEAVAQGDRYFNIPALGRHRGVAHFYLENYQTDDAAADLALAKAVGEAAIDAYVRILEQSLQQAAERGDRVSKQDAQAQLAYHTLYFFQVLTLDKGTTTGLLVHNQNDIGILGSLPAYVDRTLLASWVEKLAVPQNQLLQKLIDALPASSPCLISSEVKQQLAQVVREHYQTHPEAIALQASGDVVPPTVSNHS